MSSKFPVNIWRVSAYKPFRPYDETCFPLTAFSQLLYTLVTTLNSTQRPRKPCYHRKSRHLPGRLSATPPSQTTIFFTLITALHDIPICPADHYLLYLIGFSSINMSKKPLKIYQYDSFPTIIRLKLAYVPCIGSP